MGLPIVKDKIDQPTGKKDRYPKKSNDSFGGVFFP
jgi:hypothetical protein